MSAQMRADQKRVRFTRPSHREGKPQLRDGYAAHTRAAGRVLSDRITPSPFRRYHLRRAGASRLGTQGLNTDQAPVEFQPSILTERNVAIIGILKPDKTTSSVDSPVAAGQQLHSFDPPT